MARISVERKREVAMRIMDIVLREFDEGEGMELVLALSNISRDEGIEAVNWLQGELIEAAREDQEV